MGAAGITAVLIAYRGRMPSALAAWAAYLLLLLPVSGLVRSSLGIVADRYSYLATMPLYFPVAHGLCVPGGSARARFAARRQGRALALRRGDLGAHRLELGARIELARRRGRARACLFDGGHLSPRLPDPARQGPVSCRPQRRGRGMLPRSRRDAPLSAEAAADLGLALGARGEFEEALQWADRAISADPSYVVSYLNRGLILAEGKRYAEAAGSLQQALRINPYFVEARISLAARLARHGRCLRGRGTVFPRARQ